MYRLYIMEEILHLSYYDVTFIYNPVYMYFPEGENNINDLWTNLYMKDKDENIIQKPSKERFIELITPIFKTKMIDAIRIKRNELLLNSDWTQIPDAELTNKNEWKTYRKLLRDLPANINIEFGKEIEDYFPSSP